MLQDISHGQAVHGSIESPSSESASLMAELRRSTDELHRATESRGFHVDLVRGCATRPAYAEYLGQLYWVHDALENALRQVAEQDSRVTTVLATVEFHRDRLLADARVIADGVGSPTSHTAAFEARLRALGAQRDPALLGAHYVFEGSKNGGTILAQVAAKTFGLPGSDGTSYLNPYGREQRLRWAAYKRAMDSCGFNGAERAAIVAMAQDTFSFVGALCDNIESRGESA